MKNKLYRAVTFKRSDASYVQNPPISRVACKKRLFIIKPILT